jgi:hypothetical protein
MLTDWLEWFGCLLRGHTYDVPMGGAHYIIRRRRTHGSDKPAACTATSSAIATTRGAAGGGNKERTRTIRPGAAVTGDRPVEQGRRRRARSWFPLAEGVQFSPSGRLTRDHYAQESQALHDSFKDVPSERQKMSTGQPCSETLSVSIIHAYCAAVWRSRHNYPYSSGEFTRLTLNIPSRRATRAGRGMLSVSNA